MKYTLKPSLQHIALVKIVTMLWKQKDIRDLILKFSDSLFFEWQNIENRVNKKVPQLLIPGILKEKIISLVKPIGLQILKWKRYHSPGGYINMDLLAELCWTSQGTIDRKKTAEVLIKYGNLDIIKRYKLACIYCLKNDIVELWSKIPESHQQTLSFEYSSAVSQHLLTLHWTHVMQVGYNNPLYSNQYIFESCAKGSNKTATKYFLQKLTSFEREESLAKIAACAEDPENLFFLLSQMNEEQEKEVFKIDPYKVLQCLIDWPLQNFFIEVADRMWEFLSKEDFDRLLKRIMDKIRAGYKDCKYEKLFEKFWQKSPSGLKNDVVGLCGYGVLLPYLFEIQDKDKIQFIFHDATLYEKKKFIESYMMRNICRNSVLEEEWDFLKFFIQDCLPSGTEIIKFKEDFESTIMIYFLKNIDCFIKNKHKWDQLFFLSDSFHKNNKRESEEIGEIRPSKIHHAIQ